MSEPSILVADANEGTGRALKRLIEKENRGYRVALPQSFDDLKDSLRSQVFDSAIIYLDLNKWGGPYRMNGHIIDNGQDLARLFKALYPSADVGLCGSASAFEHYRIDPNEYAFAERVPLPPSSERIKETLEGVLRTSSLKTALKTASRVHNANPVFQPFPRDFASPKKQESAALRQKREQKRLVDYKRACSLNRHWLAFSFETIGDPSWSFVCDGSVDEGLLGAPLNDIRHKNGSHRQKRRERKYPNESLISKIGRQKNSYPYFFWNIRRPGFVDKQFKIAGKGLNDLPKYLQHDFGIGTADPQARAYLEGERDKVILRCQELTAIGKFETACQILKLLYWHKPSWIRDFSIRCEMAQLPRPVEIYKGRLESIEKHKKTGWVKLTIWDESRVPLMEPFDLTFLEQGGVKYEGDLFDYIVYVPLEGGSASKIEAVESDQTYQDADIRISA